MKYDFYYELAREFGIDRRDAKVAFIRAKFKKKPPFADVVRAIWMEVTRLWDAGHVGREY